MPKVRFKVDWVELVCGDDVCRIVAGSIGEIVCVSNDFAVVKIDDDDLYHVSYDAMRAATEPYSEVKRAPLKTYPDNWEAQFELLWAAKGRKGAKAKARDKFKALSEGASNESCVSFTAALIADIAARSDELGMAELHLTTYLNQSRWEK